MAAFACGERRGIIPAQFQVPAGFCCEKLSIRFFCDGRHKKVACRGVGCFIQKMLPKLNLVLALLCLGFGGGCGKKNAATPASSAPQAAAQAEAAPMPVATPREYLVNGQIDLNAVSETLKEYQAWAGYTSDPRVMVTRGFIKSLPPPPPGKKYWSDGMGGSAVQLVPLTKEEMKQVKPESKKPKP